MIGRRAYVHKNTVHRYTRSSTLQQWIVYGQSMVTFMVFFGIGLPYVYCIMYICIYMQRYADSEAHSTERYVYINTWMLPIHIRLMKAKRKKKEREREKKGGKSEQKWAHNQRLYIPRLVHASLRSLIWFIKFTEINGLQFILKRDKKKRPIYSEWMRWCREQLTTTTQQQQPRKKK